MPYDDLKEIIAIFKDKFPEGQAEDMISLIEYNEWGIAYENFVVQLFEYDVKISRQYYEQIMAIGHRMCIKDSYIKILMRCLDQ